MDKRDIRRHGRFTTLAMVAAKMAVEEGGLDLTKIDNDKFGVIIGSGIGGVEVIHIHHFDIDAPQLWLAGRLTDECCSGLRSTA